jgi:hypothetical protein
MDDFKPLLKGVNTNYYGMIDQLVASRGRKFFGCWHSTYVFVLSLLACISHATTIPKQASILTV